MNNLDTQDKVRTDRMTALSTAAVRRATGHGAETGQSVFRDPSLNTSGTYEIVA